MQVHSASPKRQYDMKGYPFFPFEKVAWHENKTHLNEMPFAANKERCALLLSSVLHKWTKKPCF